MAGSVRQILVSGDLVVDHHIYAGERATPAQRSKRGVLKSTVIGGANGLFELLQFVARGSRNVWVSAGVSIPSTIVQLPGPEAFAVWKPQWFDRKVESKGKVWRIAERMGFGAEAAEPPDAVDGPPEHHVLVLDDSGYGFRNKERAACWHLPKPAKDVPWILLKLSDPIGEGDLWRALIARRDVMDRLVCVVAARDLRRERALIRYRASWERTLEDLEEALDGHALSHLRKCAHLIVVFDGDGALWMQPGKPGCRATLCFSAPDTEGDFARSVDGEGVGFMTVMTAALAHGLAVTEDELAAPMEAGLRAMRWLHRNGHGIVDDTHVPAYPYEGLAKTILGTAKEPEALARLEFSWPPPRDPQATMNWTLMQASEQAADGVGPHSLVGLAADIARRGEAAYRHLPQARFGKFTTLERREIEMLRQIRRLMIGYKDVKPDDKPLNIGVFGPPGAGKSFAVKQIAEDLFGKEAWLEFNLSQFEGPHDLVGALHQVRDKVLAGTIPVVFWDEFDSRELFWLQYLLAPMQDGRFQAGEVSHAVGRSVFVFAGGTAERRALFGVPDQHWSDHRLRLVKAPDFVSRLDAHYDVSGPNPRKTLPGEAPDLGFTVRRALLLRSALSIKEDKRLEIDHDLLLAVLRVPAYRHGSRSMEKLVKPLYPKASDMVRRSELPPPSQIGQQVDAEAFAQLLAGDAAFAEAGTIELMAELTHDVYRARNKVASAYGALNEAAKHDNRAAVRRIPAVLAMVGLQVVHARDVWRHKEPGATDLAAYLEKHIERLAEAEHDGWCETKRRNGWVNGPGRDDDRRIHTTMVPYGQLAPSYKENDRAMVRAIPRRLAAGGYRVVWITD